jgi:hypothetical protein
MRCTRVALLLALGVLAASRVSAQTVCPAPCTLYVGQAFTLQADDPQPTSNVDGYRLYDGATVLRDVPTATARVGTVVSFVFASGFPATGTHNFQVSAYNVAGETKSTPPLAATVLVLPAVPLAPVNPRIVK